MGGPPPLLDFFPEDLGSPWQTRAILYYIYDIGHYRRYHLATLWLRYDPTNSLA